MKSFSLKKNRVEFFGENIPFFDPKKMKKKKKVRNFGLTDHKFVYIKCVNLSSSTCFCCCESEFEQTSTDNMCAVRNTHAHVKCIPLFQQLLFFALLFCFSRLVKVTN